MPPYLHVDHTLSAAAINGAALVLFFFSRKVNPFWLILINWHYLEVDGEYISGRTLRLNQPGRIATKLKVVKEDVKLVNEGKWRWVLLLWQLVSSNQKGRQEVWGKSNQQLALVERLAATKWWRAERSGECWLTPVVMLLLSLRWIVARTFTISACWTNVCRWRGAGTERVFISEVVSPGCYAVVWRDETDQTPARWARAKLIHVLVLTSISNSGFTVLQTTNTRSVLFLFLHTRISGNTASSFCPAPAPVQIYHNEWVTYAERIMFSWTLKYRGVCCGGWWNLNTIDRFRRVSCVTLETHSKGITDSHGPRKKYCERNQNRERKVVQSGWWNDNLFLNYMKQKQKSQSRNTVTQT